MSYALVRNFEARIKKFCTNVDDHRVMQPIEFHVLHEQVSYILMTIKFNFRLNTALQVLPKSGYSLGIFS